MMSRRPLQQLEAVRAHVPLRPFQKEPLPPISDDIFTGESMLSKFKLFIDQHTEQGTLSSTMQAHSDNNMRDDDGRLTTIWPVVELLRRFPMRVLLCTDYCHGGRSVVCTFGAALRTPRGSGSS